MEKFTKRIILLLAIALGFIGSVNAQTTYFYIGGNAGTADVSSTTAWSLTLGGAATTPTPNASAIYVINGTDVSSTAGNQAGTTMTISLGSARTVGQLRILNNNIAVTISGTGSLSVGGANTAFIAGAEIDVASGCSLTINNSGTVGTPTSNVFLVNNSTAGAADKHHVSFLGTLTVNSSRTLGISVAHAAGSTAHVWGGTVNATGTVVYANVISFNTISGTVNIATTGAFQLPGTSTTTRTTISGTVNVTATGTTAFQHAPADSSCLTITGLLNYNAAGAQTVPANYSVRNTGELRLATSGIKTLTIGGFIFGKLSRQGTTTTAGTAPTFQSEGTIEYKGSAAQTVLLNEWTSAVTQGPANVIIDNAAGVTAISRTIKGTLTLKAGAFTIPATTTITFQTDDVPIVRDGVTNTGTITMNASANLVFGTSGNLGGAAFTIPNSVFTSAPTFTDFTVNRTNQLTLNNQQITTTGTFTLTAGIVALGTADLQVSTISVSSPSATRMFATSPTSGLLKRSFTTGSFQSFTYPIGELVGTAEYNGFTFSYGPASATAVIGWKVVDDIHPSMNTPSTPANYLSRYYVSSISPSIATYSYYADLPYNGTGGDIVGTESLIGAVRWNGSAWVGTEASVNATSDVIRFPSAGVDQTDAPLGFAVTGRTLTIDAPCGATSVTPGAAGAGCTNTVTANTLGATQTFSGGVCGTADDDVWFSFTATATSHTVRVTPSASFDAVLQAYYNAACASLVSGNNIGACADAGGDGAVEDLALAGLTIGLTYYVRVWENGTYASPPASNTFDICVITPPANDEPCGAVTLTPNAAGSTTCSSPITGNVALASATTSSSACSFSSPQRDVWYRFVATATSHTVEVDGSASMYATVQCYTMATCSSTVSIISGACDVAGSLGAVASTQLTGLTPGNTYYARVFHDGSTVPATTDFTICVKTAPANDEPCGAVTLTPATTCSTTAGNVALASQTTYSSTCAFSSPQNDVWYRFVATATSHTIDVDGSASMYATVQCYTMATCSSTVAAISGACDGVSTLGAVATVQLTGLTVGNTYYARVFHDGSAPATTDFTICVKSPPANDEPCGSVTLTPNAAGSTICSAPVTGNVTMASQTTYSSTCAFSSPQRDVWFRFVATATSHTVEVDGSASMYAAVQCYTMATCSSTVAAISGACDGVSTLGAVASTQLTGLTVGNTYYARVWHDGSTVPATTDFTICVKTAPANDERCGAVTLTPASTCSTTTGNVALASQTLSSFTCASSTPQNDVWYRFVATATSHNIQVDGSASMYATVQCYTMPTCSTTATAISGACDGASLLGDVASTTLTGLTIGSTYYARVFHDGSSVPATTDFTICVTSPPANDVCSGAVALACGGTVTGTTALATDDTGLTFCGSSSANFKGVWYAMTAPAAGQVILSLCSGTSFDTYLRVYSGSSCGALTCVSSNDDFCSSQSQVSFFANGTSNYYVLVSGFTSSDAGNFSLTATCYPAPSNNDCGGTLLTVGSAATTGTVLGASQTLSGPYGPGYDDDDVWYNFVAPASGAALITLTEDINPNLFDGVLELRDNSSCNAVRIQARDFTAGGGSTETMRVTGLTVGGSYKLRIFSYLAGSSRQGGFTIRVQNTYTPSTYDNVCSAQAYPVAQLGTPLSGNSNSTMGFEVGEPTGSNWGYDVDFHTSVPSNTQWYKFIPTTSGSYTISASQASGVQLAVYTATSNLCSNILVAGSRTEIGSDYSTTSAAASLTNLCLTSGTSYYIQVNGDMGSSGIPSLTITNTNPAAPAASSITTSDCSSFTAEWNTVTNATAYVLDVATDAGFSSIVSGYNGLNVGNVTSYGVTGLTAGQQYYFRVRAIGTCSFTSANSNAPSITLPANVGTPSFTAGATALCEGTTSTYIATASNSSGVSYSIVGGIGATIDANTGVVSNVTGNFTVRATATGTCGANTTADRSVIVTPNVGTPSFTAGATTLCAGATSTYTATASNSTGVTYSIFSGGATIDANTGVVSSVTSNFTVRTTAAGCGSNTTADFAVTVNPLPATVVATAGTGATTTSIIANWGAAANNISYILEVSDVSDFSSSGVFYAYVGNVTSYTVLQLNPNTTYYYRIYATNLCGVAPVSNTIAYATLPNVSGPLTWDGSTSTDWNDITNWTPQNIPTALDDVIVPNVTNDPALTTGANGNIKDMSISVGATLTIGTGRTIDVKGNWVGANNTISGAGNLIFSGTSAQTITGGATVSKLQINNGSGVTVATGGNRLNITTSLDLVVGQLNTNSNLTIKSSIAGQAYIDDFSGSNAGTITGNIIVERYIPASPNGFRYIGAPVRNGATTMALSNLGGSFVLSGTPGQTIPLPTCSPTFQPINVSQNSPYATFMYWQENGPYGSPACRQRGWWFQTTGNMNLGQGYGAKVGGNTVITYTGIANTGTITSTAVNTHSAIFSPSGNNGWNLVSNPFPSAIRIDETGANADPLNDMPAGYDKQMQFYITTGTNTGSYQPIQVLTGAPANIALGQGFWVRVTNPGTTPPWTLGQGHRTTGSPTYFESNAIVEDRLNVSLTGNGFGDQTDINFVDGATPGFDLFDANKWFSALGQPTLFTKVGDEFIGINSHPLLTNSVDIPMGLSPGANGTFTFTFNDVATFPQSAIITLEDFFTDSIIDMRAQPTYTFNSLATDTFNRFMLHFQPGVIADVVNQDCDNAAGSITFTQNGTTVWDSYTVTDNSNNTYAQGNNYSGAITVNNLAPQEYIITLVRGDYTAQEFITVNSIGVPIVSTLAVSDTTVLIGEQVNFTSTATNATNYSWNFGDGNTAQGSLTQQHTYAAIGEYLVTFTAFNDSCSETLSQTVYVGTVGINNQPVSNLSIYGQGEKVVIQFNNWGGNKANITMYNTLGQRVESLTGVSTIKGRQELNVAGIIPGYYFIQVVSGDKVESKKVYLGNN
jgi:hypothetical protein